MGFLDKGILLYLLLAIAISFWQPQVIFSGDSPSDATVLSWFNVRLDPTTNQPYYQSENYEFQGSAGTSAGNMTVAPKMPGTSSLFGFLDPVYQVFNWVKTFFKIVFSPIVMFTKPEMVGAPIAIMMIIGIPIVTLFIVGLIYWIRGGS